MDRVPARVLERGRVTIPKDVRDDLGLEPGDRVLLDVEPIDSDRVAGPWVVDG